MKVAEAMTKWVLTTTPEASVVDAAKVMLQNNISGLPVVDKSGKLVGIVSEGDFLRRAELQTQRKRPHWIEVFVSPGQLAEEFSRSHSVKISEIMTRNPKIVTEQTSLGDAVELMEQYQIKRLPVVRDGVVTGILSRSNILRAFASRARKHDSSDNAADWAVRDQILEDIKKQPWVPSQSINVIVKEGMVDLWGTVYDDRQRKALLVAAEQTPGVTKVRDHLTVVPAPQAIPF